MPLLDEWLIRPLSPQESYDLLEIVEARCQRSMIFCTQYQSEGWYTRIDPNPDSGSPVSEAIMDRIIHNAYEVLVEGRVSMREKLHFYLKRIQLLESILTENGIPVPEYDD